MAHFDSQKSKQTYQKISPAKHARFMKRFQCQKTVYAGSTNRDKLQRSNLETLSEYVGIVS